MKNNLSKQHWEKVYKTRDTTKEVSWHQDNPQISIELILSTNVDKSGNIIDIGGGDSRFVDILFELGFKSLFVLDISAESLKKAKTRLGDKATLITWIESNVLDFETNKHFDIWHDRATFHFLTKKEDISKYIELANLLIKPNGYLIISTFSTNGPQKCSGLDITQYSEDSIKKIFGGKFKHIKSFEQVHTTPFNTKQNFIYSIFKKSNY